MLERCKRYVLGKADRLPLSVILTVPFVLQTITAVGLTGWLSLSNGSKSVNRLAHELSNQITARIQHRVIAYLDGPHQLNQVLEGAIASNTLNPNDLSSLQTFFWHQIQQAQPGSTLLYGNPLGEVIGIHKTFDNQCLLLLQKEATNFNQHLYGLDKFGQPTSLIKRITPPRKRYPPWYVAAQQKQAPTWGPIVQPQAFPYLGITAAHPLFQPDGDLRGVLGITIALAQLTEFLQELTISDSGQAFIMERSGQLVATSGQQPPIVSIGTTQQRANAINSQDPLIQDATQHLLEHFESFDKIKQNQSLDISFQNHRHLIEVTPLADERGLDWLVVVVIPKADFTTEIQAKTRRTVVLCLLSLLLSLLLGIFTSQRIGHSKQHLANANQILTTQLAATLESTAEGILSHTQAGKILAYNQKFVQMWNIPEVLLGPDSIPAERLQFLVDQTQDPEGFRARVLELCKDTPEADALELIEMRNGRIFERYTQPQRICDRIVGRIWTYRDVTDSQQAAAALEAANRTLERLAHLDGLTQVANRRYLDTYLAHEWQRLALLDQPLSLILFDVDFFKHYNDHYGHQAGDDCLVKVAQTVQQTINQPTALVARYGGEEFAIVLPNTQCQEAIKIVQQLPIAIQHLQIPHIQSAVSPFLTISLGLTCQIPTLDSGPDQLIWQADNALYRAKRNGRNCYCVYAA